MPHMIVKKYKETKLGVLISDKNKRNTKDPTKLKKLKKLKPTLIEKLLLKKDRQLNTQIIF